MQLLDVLDKVTEELQCEEGIEAGMMEEVHEILKEFQESAKRLMKCYHPEVFFTSVIEDKNKEEFVEVISLSFTRDATFPVIIMGVNCNALINTGATKCCISETFYNQLVLPWLLKVFHLLIASASVQWVLHNVSLY